MNEKTNHLRDTLSHSAMLGTWSLLPSPSVVEVLARGGMDFLILDMEHGPYGLSELENAIRACEVAGAAALVRVPGTSSPLIQSALDLGAQGIVLPRIGGADDAKHALAAMHFAPQGTRGFNPFTRAFGYDPESAETSDHRPFSCCIIEEKSAVDGLKDILAIPELDACYIGVYDLSVALGYSGDVTHPALRSLVETMTKSMTAAGKIAGMMVGSEQEVEHALSIGARMLVWTVDTFLIRNAVSAAKQVFTTANDRHLRS